MVEKDVRMGTAKKDYWGLETFDRNTGKEVEKSTAWKLYESFLF